MDVFAIFEQVPAWVTAITAVCTAATAITALTPSTADDKALAADIWWSDWEPMAQLDFARLAHDGGWSVGLNRTFVHVDRRIDIGLKSQVFLYKNWRGYFSAQDIEDFV